MKSPIALLMQGMKPYRSGDIVPDSQFRHEQNDFRLTTERTTGDGVLNVEIIAGEWSDDRDERLRAVEFEAHSYWMATTTRGGLVLVRGYCPPSMTNERLVKVLFGQ